MQPWCVHTAANALKSPSVGWVTTTLASRVDAAPPTGTEDVVASAAAALGVSVPSALGSEGDSSLGDGDGEEDAVGAVGASSEPQAARTGTPTAMAAAAGQGATSVHGGHAATLASRPVRTLMVLTRTSSQQPSGPGPASRLRHRLRGRLLRRRLPGRPRRRGRLSRPRPSGDAARRAAARHDPRGCGARNVPVWLLRDGRDLLGRALGDDHAAAADPPSGPMSMTQSAVLMTSRLCSMTRTELPLSTSAGQHAEQLADVLEVQTGRRLVEDVDGPAGGALLQLAGELDALRLAAGERRRRLAEADVAEPDVDQRRHVPRDRRAPRRRTRRPPRSACRGPRRSSCPCSAPRASRGCSGRRGTPRTGRRRPGGSSSRS